MVNSATRMAFSACFHTVTIRLSLKRWRLVVRRLFIWKSAKPIIYGLVTIPVATAPWHPCYVYPKLNSLSTMPKAILKPQFARASRISA